MEKRKGMKMTAIAALLIACATPRDVVPAHMYQDRQAVVTNFPNPFDSRTGVTTIVYSLNTEAEVSAKIYDLFGNLVRQYPAMRQAPGTIRITWDGTNEAGQKVAKGGYLFIVEVTAESSQTLAVRKIGVVH